ncbi:MAG: ABC transporter permease, partial [Spirochaetia bacterium]
AYLGLGAPPPQSSWGRMLLEAQESVVSSPWGAIFPGLAIVTAVMGLNFLGDGIREMLDPEMK